MSHPTPTKRQYGQAIKAIAQGRREVQQLIDATHRDDQYVLSILGPILVNLNQLSRRCERPEKETTAFETSDTSRINREVTYVTGKHSNISIANTPEQTDETHATLNRNNTVFFDDQQIYSDQRCTILTVHW